MAQTRRSPRTMFTDDERVNYVQLVDNYRAEHPEAGLPAAIKWLKLPIVKGNYHAWKLRMSKGTLGASAPVVEFPLEAIPARTTAARPINGHMSLRQRRAVVHDEDKEFAAQLLEIAARLLKR